MDTTLEVSPRTAGGKGTARKLRGKGSVPGVIYGATQEPISVTVDPTRLTEIFKQTQDRNTILQVKVGGQTLPCIVREVQRHPVSRAIRHVDLFAVPLDGEIEVMIPLKAEGRPKGAVLGGRLRIIRREIKASCRYDRIPKSFVIDVSPLDIGDFVKASEIPLPEGVRLPYLADYNVLGLYGKKQRGDAPAAES